MNAISSFARRISPAAAALIAAAVLAGPAMATAHAATTTAAVGLTATVTAPNTVVQLTDNNGWD